MRCGTGLLHWSDCQPTPSRKPLPRDRGRGRSAQTSTEALQTIVSSRELPAAGRSLCHGSEREHGRPDARFRRPRSTPLVIGINGIRALGHVGADECYGDAAIAPARCAVPDDRDCPRGARRRSRGCLCPTPAVCRASVWYPLQRQCGDVDGRVEVAAFRLVLAAERVAASNLGRPGFRAREGSCCDAPRCPWPKQSRALAMDQTRRRLTALPLHASSGHAHVVTALRCDRQRHRLRARRWKSPSTEWHSARWT
jgi:hypothetical protein